MRGAWLVLMVVLVSGCARPEPIGTDLGALPAPPIRLRDQHDRAFDLADLRGKVVVLTFLYTSCPDTCPLVVAKVRQARAQLGRDAGRVAVVVVTVDPARDTVARLQEYHAAMALDDGWHLLSGETAALGAVWAAYGIAVRPDAAGGVGHTDAVYLLDAAGRRRLLLRSDATAADLAHDVRILL